MVAFGGAGESGGLKAESSGLNVRMLITMTMIWTKRLGSIATNY
jgi:hypothetical protein